MTKSGVAGVSHNVTQLKQGIVIGSVSINGNHHAFGTIALDS